MRKLLILLLVLGLAAPAMAADFRFYGSLRTHLGYYSVSEDYTWGPAMDGSIRSTGTEDDAGTLLNLSGQSRFGAKVAVSDTLSAVFEVGLRESNNRASNAADVEQVYLRQLHGTWNFGPGKLTIGKNYTPATFLGYSSMIGDLGDNGDAVMLAAGLAYISRQPLLQLQFGTFELAFIQPNTAVTGLGSLTDVDFILPRIEAAYVFRTPMISIRPIAGFQTYDIEDASGNNSETITSYLVGLGVSLNLGPAYVKATASYMQNPADYGQNNVLVLDAALIGGMSAQLVNNDIEDASLFQGTFVVGAKLNPMFGVEAGFGIGKAENTTTLLGDVEQTGWVGYLQFPITAAKGFTIIPEIGYVDRGDLDVEATSMDAGSMTYFDVNFRISF